MKTVILLNESFNNFAIGDFPYDRDASARGEYHYFKEDGYYGEWIDQVTNYTYRGTGPSWIITSVSGCHYMECMRIEKNNPHRMFPTLQTGKLEWRDYQLEAKMRRLSTKGSAGLCFAMNNSIDTLVFQLKDSNRAELIYRHKEELLVLECTEYHSDCDTFYELKIILNGSLVDCFINDQLVISARSEIVDRGGKIGITGDCPTAFTDVIVKVSETTAQKIKYKKELNKKLEDKRLSQHPKMMLWKKIDLKNFGTSRQIRFGHLLGGKEWHIVLAQMQKRVKGDSYGFISCLTAIDLDGRVLWQIGEPSKQTDILGKISADMPLQVYDIDNDGIDEVIVGLDFNILILDGRTGNIKKQVKTPLSDDNDEELIGVDYNIYAFDRINPDGIRIANFSGKNRPSDILIKDRYSRVYALDENLKLLWKYKSSKNTGHCPIAIDVNGDGHDEVLVGYTLLSCDGKEIWTYPIDSDHVDEIVAGKFRDDNKGYFACVAGTEGFFIGDFEGNILFRDYIGHAQRLSIANFCKERKGFEIVVSNYWGHQGVIYLYDTDGNLIWEMENEMNGNILAPINWDGDGSELILTNANADKGGLIDGDGLRAVVFPDDGHPDLCVESINLCGDNRNELVVWDYYNLWIYTQDDNPKHTQYSPIQFPEYNASNYRGEYSYPDISYMKFP